MRYCVYAQWAKARHFTEAVVAGFPGAVRPLEGPLADDDRVAVLGGLQFGALELLIELRRLRRPYVFFDRAYFGGGTYTDRLRLTRDAYQQHWIRSAGAGNAAGRWGVTLAPWRQDGDFIVVVPPSDSVARLFGLRFWLPRMLSRLEKCSRRRVVVSPKSDREKSPLAERLEGCYAVVTWTSNVAVEAVCLGVPAFTSPWSAAAPVSGRLDEIERDLATPWRGDRRSWAAGLAAGQFTVDEIASGAARRRLEEEAVAA